MKTTFVTLLGFVSLAIAAPASLVSRQDSLQQATDHYLFEVSIDEFEAARNAQAGPAGLDWSSDGCSSSPDNPLGFDFLHSCHRHDFGYRNYKAQSRFTDANKARIDDNFKADMYNQCANEEAQDACEGVANLYYEAVKLFGKKRAAEFVGKLKERREVEARRL